MMHFFHLQQSKSSFPIANDLFPIETNHFLYETNSSQKLSQQKKYDIIKCQHCKMKPSDHRNLNRNLNRKHDQTM